MTNTPENQDGAGFNEWVPHLSELRRRIISILVVILLATITAFIFSSHIVSFLLTPLYHLDVELHTFAPSEKFLAYVHIAFWTGAIFTIPFLCLQIALFVWPALRNKEHRYMLVALLVVPILFILGSALCYYFLAPVILNFFLTFAEGDGMSPIWGFRQYLSLLFGLMLAGGLLLQGPLAVLVLLVAGVVQYKTFARLRPYIILLIFFLAALVTPPDVISQILLGIPLYLLFEGALFLGRIFRKSKR
ncbi:MAG: twin-arginine translocase subunit TatC [Treponema sp.]|nr:twin-arginine translocase subunit TatC [Treponema sp.]